MSSKTTLINSLLENLFNYESQKTNLHHNGNTGSAPNEVDDQHLTKLMIIISSLNGKLAIKCYRVNPTSN